MSTANSNSGEIDFAADSVTNKCNQAHGSLSLFKYRAYDIWILNNVESMCKEAIKQEKTQKPTNKG